MTIYEKELATLRRGDEIITSELTEDGLPFITTASHGYLAVPRGHRFEHLARKICDYGYLGKHAIYLEEDVEAPLFIKTIHNDY